MGRKKKSPIAFQDENDSTLTDILHLNVTETRVLMVINGCHGKEWKILNT